MSNGTLYINGKWTSGKGAPLESNNPATNELIWEGKSASDHEVKEAVNAAKLAFKSWSGLFDKDRIYYLDAFRKNLEKERDTLSEIISKETGKPLWESQNEVSSMIAKVDISIEAYHARTGETKKPQANALSVVKHKPHGAVVVLGPFNFPGHLPNGHIIPALLAGNTVIFKPSELTPLVGEYMMKLWEKTQIPSGVINLLQGGSEVGKAISTNLNIDGLFFTGSWNTGKILSQHFGNYPEKILALEMGGNNPLVVTQTSNLKAAAYLIVQSAYATSGQRCTCARRLIVLNNATTNKLLEEIKTLISKIKVGKYTDQPEPFMGPVINEAAAKKLLDAQQALIAKGGILVSEMKKVKENLPLLTPGLIDVTSIRERADEEYFGPLLQVIRVPNLEIAIEEANNTRYGLVSGLISDSREEFEDFYRSSNAGCINFNAPLTGASSAAPFGGIKRSGNHRPSAFYAADYCAYPVSSLINEEVKMPEGKLPGITL